jgi:hypothetical protein
MKSIDAEGRTQLAGVVEIALAVQRGLHDGDERHDGSCALPHLGSDLWCCLLDGYLVYPWNNHAGNDQRKIGIKGTNRQKRKKRSREGNEVY